MTNISLDRCLLHWGLHHINIYTAVPSVGYLQYQISCFIEYNTFLIIDATGNVDIHKTRTALYLLKRKGRPPLNF